jgi:hypothetical protein
MPSRACSWYRRRQGAQGRRLRGARGPHPVQRCVRHRERNVVEHLPERHRPAVKRRLRRAWARDDHRHALDEIRHSPRSWSARIPAPPHRSASASRRRSPSPSSASTARSSARSRARTPASRRSSAAPQLAQRQALAQGRDGAALDGRGDVEAERSSAGSSATATREARRHGRAGTHPSPARPRHDREAAIVATA